MARSSQLCFLLLFTVFALDSDAKLQSQAGDTIRLSLASYANSTENDPSVVAKVNLSPGVSVVVEVSDVPLAVSFVVVQAHTHETNMSMSYGESMNCDATKCVVNGSNVGLVLDAAGNGSLSVILTLLETSSRPIDAIVAAVAYTDKAPIPGGCNMEFDTEVAPYQKLRLTEATVTLEAQPASGPRNANATACGETPIKLALYRMYLPEGDVTQDTYFAALQKMLTVQDIVANGREILPTLGASPVRRVFSAYPGTGSIYAIVATYGNHSSAYVPAATYACSVLAGPSSCGNLDTKTAQALCAIVLIVGIVITFVGHRFLGFEVFFLGTLCGGLFSYGILTSIGYFQTSTVLGMVMGAAFLSGIGWLVLTLCTNKGCITTFLSSMTLGFLVASTIYFSIADDTALFESNVSFWLIFTSVTLLVPIVLAVLPFCANIVCCAILGAYSIILPIDYYAGSNLKYIVINTMRRATVPDFNRAVIQPPFQSTDKWLVAFLVLLAIFGIYAQMTNLLRFICCCLGERQTTVYWRERQPIISASRGGRRVLVFGENDRVQHWNE